MGHDGERSLVADHRMTPTSYLVLGLLADGPATSYQLKQRVAMSIGNFWEFAHSQLYDEPVVVVDWWGASDYARSGQS